MASASSSAGGQLLDCLLASSALAAAALHLASTLDGSAEVWRKRVRELIAVAVALAHDVDALRSVRSGALRRAHVARIGKSADDAAALAMRVHNLLPRGASATAAFDVAACATAVAASVRNLSESSLRPFATTR